MGLFSCCLPLPVIENTKSLGLVILSGGNCCFNLSFCALVSCIFFCFFACMLFFNSIYENPFFFKKKKNRDRLVYKAMIIGVC